jgi:hypothetical protein
MKIIKIPSQKALIFLLGKQASERGDDDEV